MTQTEALKLALEALESCDSDYDWDGDGDERQVDVYDRDKVNKAITAIKEVLAQPKQIFGFDVVIDESMPPNTFKLAQPEQSCPECVFGVCHCKPLAQPEQEPRTAKEKLTRMKSELAYMRNAQPEQEHRCCPHDSDCAVHNMPAYPAGPCDCTYKNTHNLPPSAVVHEICLTLIKRALDTIENENFGRMPNDSWTNKVLDVYHFFDSNPKAKKLTVIYTTPPQRTWVGLTDAEIDVAIKAAKKVDTGYAGWVRDQRKEYAKAIEAKLKEKNL